jgi:hypothetical protein
MVFISVPFRMLNRLRSYERFITASVAAIATLDNGLKPVALSSRHPMAEDPLMGVGFK